MKKLLCYLKGYEKETVLAPLFKMLEALFELFVPLVMAAVIEQGNRRIGQTVHREDVYAFDCAGCHRTGLLDYSAVFCGESGDRIFHPPAP